ncbi:ABC transporter ATP-binding protein [Ancylobacter lacus]|nr:ABC transporter ATP-binding protein [Ancylobacter lacus]
MIYDVISYCNAETKRRIFPLVFLMFAGAMAELISIGSVFPFIAAMNDPDLVMRQPNVAPLLAALGITTPHGALLAVAGVFALAALAAGLVRILLVWNIQRFSLDVTRDTVVNIYTRLLYRPYDEHIAQNSSSAISLVEKAQVIARDMLIPFLQAVTASVIAAIIIAGLFMINPMAALVAGGVFGSIYGLIFTVSRRILLRNGAVISAGMNARVQALNEGIGGIRDVILHRSQPWFIARFGAIDSGVRRAQAQTNLVLAVPRFAMEAVGLVLVAVLAVFLSLTEGGLTGVLPLLGALALGAQRLLPLLQQIYHGCSLGASSRAVLQEVLTVLRRPARHLPQEAGAVAPLPFTRSIEAVDLVFRYPGSSRPTLKGVNFCVPKGGRVGIVGRTGSGKSTLIDLILGLLSPTAGTLSIDGVPLTEATCRAWQEQLAHVPQSVFLSDGTIADNIAFGIPAAEIDQARLLTAVRQAALHDVVESLPEGLATRVGERGVRLSGGQRQRIGIARALYRRAQVLVLDEATSALDNETEDLVMNAINMIDKDITIFMIAHRLRTIEKFDLVMTVADGDVNVVSR